MKLCFRLPLQFGILLLSAALASCTSKPVTTISLATFTEHDVKVSVSLVRDTDGKALVSAAFVPPDGYHLYSKDVPNGGIDGLGRPTLIELTTKSLMKATGTLIESAKPQAPGFEPRELQVYPAGPVTLGLPVQLPPGKDWMEDEVSLTYMACSASKCKPPVVGKIVKVRIPAAETEK